MLESLANVDAKIAEASLASLIGDLLPQTAWDTDIHAEGDHLLKDKILDELRSQLRISRDDTSDVAKAALVRQLSVVLEEAVLAAVDIRKLRARLSGRQLLPPSSYQLDLPEGTVSTVARRSITREQLLDAISHPTGFDQLPPENLPEIENMHTIAFLTRNFEFHGEPCTLLLHVRILEDVLTVATAWNVFPKDIGGDGLPPLALLNRFLDRYGVGFTVYGRSTSQKLLIYDALPVSAPTPADHLRVTDAYPGMKVENHVDWFVTKLNILLIAGAYIVDLTKYYSDLNRRGISTRLPETHELHRHIPI